MQGFTQSPGGPALSAGTHNQKSVDFPSPWLDYASWQLPQSMTQVLRWAEFIWLSNGTYRQACSRIARFFITNLQITGVDDKEAKEIREIFMDGLKIMQLLTVLGDNFMCYGNLFPIATMPFKRYLQCNCGFTIPLRTAGENQLYKWRNYKFEKGAGGCPNCGHRHQHVPWTIHDEYSRDVNDLRITLLSPHEMEIGHFAYSGDKEFHWNIPTYMSGDLQKGVPLALENCPKEIIEAVRVSNGRFTFNSDVIFHHAEMAPAGVYTGGWGIPRVISNFRLAYHYQVLNRYDQAIAMDYVNGMRVISPEQGTGANGAGDPILGVGGAAFNRIVQQMITTHRKDPASWNVSGFPLRYQLFGGEGAQLSPKDLMEFKLNEWLDATGMPAELFHGNLSVQAAPMALRLFQNSWPEITSLYNNTLEWLANFMHQMLDMPEFKVELTPVRFADDMERKQIMLQLMAGNQVSPQTALKSFGIDDPREEVRRVYEWQKILAEEEKDFGEDMDQMAQADQIKQEMAAQSQGQAPGMAGPGGAPPPGGAPMDPMAVGMGGGGMGAPAPGSTQTPEAMTAEADRLAQEIMQMEATARRSALINLKKADEVLHALVSQRIETLENQAATAGKQLARQGQI